MLKRLILPILFLVLTVSLFAQEPAKESNNPLVALRDEVKHVLSDAGVPFVAAQPEKSIPTENTPTTLQVTCCGTQTSLTGW